MSHTILSTINDGQTTISLTVDNLRHALRLPIRDQYADLPSDASIRRALTAIGYDISKQGNRDASQHVLRQCLSPGWKFLTGALGKCLTSKNSSYDQLNTIEQQGFTVSSRTKPSITLNSSLIK